jgi:hypothetical protein
VVFHTVQLLLCGLTSAGIVEVAAESTRIVAWSPGTSSSSVAIPVSPWGLPDSDYMLLAHESTRAKLKMDEPKGGSDRQSHLTKCSSKSTDAAAETSQISGRVARAVYPNDHLPS